MSACSPERRQWNRKPQNTLLCCGVPTPGLPTRPAVLPSAPAQQPQQPPAHSGSSGSTVLSTRTQVQRGCRHSQCSAWQGNPPAPCPQHVAVPLSPHHASSRQPGWISELPWELPERWWRCFHKQRRQPSSLGPSSEQGGGASSVMGAGTRLRRARVCPGWRKHLLSPSRWLLSHPCSRQIPKGFPDK